ncbi:MAG: fibronectin type III domain-containing protein [Myxococcus sp.]|nr:fibronectin type III domain-containing protein [Myxococcus sp.]
MTGTLSTRYFLVNGTTTTAPNNLTTGVIQALIPNGTSYTTLNGTGQANGTFIIPNVPQGTFLLRLGTTLLETSNRTFTFENAQLGRPNATTATVNPTTMVVNVSSHVAWAQGQDEFIWVSPNVGATFYDYETYASTPPTAGATSSSLSVNFNGTLLVDQSAGDQVWLLQNRFTTDGGVGVGGTIAAAALPPFSQLNGQTTSVSTALQTPPALPGLTQSLNWNLNAFAALQPSLPPGTNPRGTIVFSAFPSTTPSTLTLVNSWFSLVTAGLPPPTTFTLLTPFPSGWAITGRTFFAVDTPRTVPGTSGPVALASGLGHYDTLAALTGAPITPRLGPVTNITLNGTALTTDRTGAGTTLQLAWTAPGLGTPTTYYVIVSRLNGAPGAATSVAERFTISVAGTSLTIPPSILIPGQPYVFEVQAVSSPFNARAEFFTAAVPTAISYVVTPIVTL